jgi:hypothetical protein
MRSTTAALVLALAAMPHLALAQGAKPEQDHAAHHPAGASAPASGVPAQPGKLQKAAAPSAAPDEGMKAMHEMHAKMMAAKTMEERQALMAEHMKAMQQGMAMMSQMKKGPGGTSSEAMSKRMDRMEMMMQMMMDREAARAPAVK